jgi:hypothetical protein
MQRLLGLQRAVAEGAEVAERQDGGGVGAAEGSQPGSSLHCRRRCPGYDWGEDLRRWRALDLGMTFC